MGPQGDVRFSVVLSVVFKTPEMHIPPWYRFMSGTRPKAKGRLKVWLTGTHRDPPHSTPTNRRTDKREETTERDTQGTICLGRLDPQVPEPGQG